MKIIMVVEIEPEYYEDAIMAFQKLAFLAANPYYTGVHVATDDIAQEILDIFERDAGEDNA